MPIDKYLLKTDESLRTKIRDKIEQKSWVNPVTKCVMWDGALTKEGYARIENYEIRRLLWEMEMAPLRVGQRLTNSCGNRACVNIDHIILVDPITDLELRDKEDLKRYESK